MNRNLLTFFLFIMGSIPVLGQEPASPPATPATQERTLEDGYYFTTNADSIPLQPDSLAIAEGTRERRFDPDHSPFKAIMYALVLPGLGQGYNQKYYKIPIVYAALGGAVYAINFNTKKYRASSLDYAFDQSETNQRYLRFWRRNMELSYIGLFVAYALQVIDSYVDANLYSWDVNSNLTMRITPSLQPIALSPGMMNRACGITCSIDFGRN